MCVLPVLLLASRVPDARAAADLDGLLREERALAAQAEAHPDDSSYRAQMADLRAKIANRFCGMERILDAIDYLRNSVDLDPGHAARWEMLGDLYNFNGDPANIFLAQDAYERTLKLDPERRSAREKLAAAYVYGERYLRAIDQYEQIVGAGTGAPDGAYIGVLAGLYAQTGDLDRGRAFCRKMIDRGGDARFRVALAVLLRASGDSMGAARELATVMDERDVESDVRAYAAALAESYAAPEAKP